MPTPQPDTSVWVHKRARCHALARMRTAILSAAGCPKERVLSRLARIDVLLVETAAAYYDACPMSRTRYGRPVGLA